MTNILVVDDEEVLQDVLGTLLKREGLRPLAARTGEEALLIAEREPIDLVLLDLMLPGMSGMEVLKQIRGRDPEQVVIVVTPYPSIESAIQAIAFGAFPPLHNPLKHDQVPRTPELRGQRLQPGAPPPPDPGHGPAAPRGGCPGPPRFSEGSRKSGAPPGRGRAGRPRTCARGRAFRGE